MKKIVEIILLDLKPGQKLELGVVGFGFDSAMNHDMLAYAFSDAILQYCKQGLPNRNILSSLIISASETLQINYPEIAAQVRRSNVEFQKQQKNEP